MNKKGAFALCAAILCLSGIAMPTVAQSSKLAMLDTLAKGEWTVRFRDGSTERKMCLKDGRELIQIRHTGPKCNRFIVDDEASSVTVQYTCAGNGYGRTSIRRETSDLVQIESHGFIAGQPFEFLAEARRTGSCR